MRFIYKVVYANHAGYAGPYRRANVFDLPQYTALKFDIDKAKALLGFTPRVTLQEGLAKMLATLNLSGATTRRPDLWRRWTL